MMENQKENSSLTSVIIILLVVVILGLVSFIVYDKVIKKDEVKNNTSGQGNTQENTNNGGSQGNIQENANNGGSQGNTQQSVNSDSTNNNESSDRALLDENTNSKIIGQNFVIVMSKNYYDVHYTDGKIYKSPYYSSLNSAGDVIFAIDGQKLKIIEHAFDRTNDQTNLSSNNYVIVDVKNIETNDKLCSVDKAGIYVFLSNGVNGNDEKLYAMYYNPNTQEKSELIEGDGQSYGNLVSCK